MEDLSQYTDEELQKVVASGGTWRREEPQQAAAEPMLNSQGEDDLSQYTDEELQRVVDSGGTWRRPAPSAAPSAPAAPVSTKEQAIERARQQGEGETGFWGTVGGAALEGARGAGRAVKAAGQGVLGTATGVVRLVGTPVRIATGWDGIHRLADKIDQSYANFGADALMSEYGENPDGWGYALGRGGEKVAGVAGSLLGIGGPGLIAKAGKLPGAVRATGAAVQKALPFMFGNDAAVRAYDTARGNGRSKGEAAALAGLNGAIHFIGFKLFENKSLNKMLGMPQEMEAMMPKWAGEAAAAAPQGFNSLARSVRNGMIKYTLAERGKGMLKAGGIMGVQNLLSDPVMQVAEGKSLDDIDLSRTGRAGLEGLEEGALMEGLMGGAAIYKSPKAAREFIADKLYRGKDYKVIGSDGKPHNEPGLLETPQGRMFIMKQNPAATERVLDIVDHDGKPTKAELDAAFLPPDMSLKELKKFHDDWYNDLSVEKQRGGDERILDDHEETEMAQGPSRTDVDLAGIRARAREIREEERDERRAGQLIEQQAEQMQRAAQEQQAAKEEQDAYDQAMAEHEEGRYLAGKPESAKTTIEIPDEALKQGAAPEEGKTPTQEKPNETRNGADEAPAQPEQGIAGEPEAGEAARPVEAEPPRAEAPREGVVEQGKSPDAAAPSATPPSQPAENGPTTAPKSAEAQAPAEPPKTPQEPSAEAGQKETPTVEKPPEAVSAAPAAAPVPDGKGKMKKRKGEKAKAEEPPPPAEEHTVPAETAAIEALRETIRTDPELLRIDAAWKMAKTDAERNALKARFDARVEEIKAAQTQVKPTERAETDPLAPGNIDDTLAKWDAERRESAKKVKLSSEAIADIKDWMEKNPDGDFTHDGMQKIFDAEMERVKAANGGVRPGDVMPTLDAISVAYKDMKAASRTESEGPSTYTPAKELVEAKDRIEAMPTDSKSQKDAKKKAQKDWLLSSVDDAIKSHAEAAAPEGSPSTEKFVDDYEALLKRRNSTYDRKKLDKIHEQIDKARETFQKGEMITFDVPDNGTFKVYNNPEALTLFKRRVQKRLAPTALKEGTILKAERPLAEDIEDAGIGAKVDDGSAVPSGGKGGNRLKSLAPEGDLPDLSAELPAPKSNRLRRADGTDPLAEAEQTAAKPAAVEAADTAAAETTEPPAVQDEAPASAKRGRPKKSAEQKAAVAKTVVKFGNMHGEDPNDGFDAQKTASELLAKDTLTSRDVRELMQDLSWTKNLGLTEENAGKLRYALDEVFADRFMKAKYKRLMHAKTANADGDFGPYGLSLAASEALTNAKRKGDANGERWASSILQKASQEMEGWLKAAEDEAAAAIKGASPEEIAAAKEEAVKLSIDADAKKYQSWLDAQDRLEGRMKQSLDAPAEGEEGDVAKNEALEGKAAAAIAERNAKDGNVGNRRIQLETKNGETYVVWRNEMGEVVRRAPLEMLEKAARKDPGIRDLIEGLKQGEQYRASMSSAAGLPDAWTPEAQKSLERVAHVLRNVVTAGGKKLKVSFADRPAEADGQTRKSISGIFTGTAADYAIRSREGGKDDGPSTKKIGTGEGAQVYGWGLYGSNRRGVGITYAQSDVGRKGNGKLPFLRGIDGAGTKKNGVLMEKPRKEDYNLDLQYWADMIAWESPNERIALQTAKKYGEAIESYLEAYIKDYEFANDVPSEHLYEQTFFTNRAPGDESHLLKWYDAISDANWDRVIAQAEKEGLRGKLKGAWWLRFNGDLEHFITDNGNSGDAIYESLSRLLGGPQAASEFLARAGIDGVKYPVGTAGGKVKDGDKVGWNYVSFRDDNIRVDHKWTDGELRYMRNSDGVTVGEYDAAKGEIRLYPGARVADVVHEFTHPLVDFARAKANAGRGELMDKIKQIIDAERATWEQPVRDAYKGKGEEEILEEIFTHAMGEKGEKLFGKSTNTLQGRQWYKQLWEKIKGLWQDFATKMGWNRADLRGLDGMSPEDAAQKILSEMAKGRNFGDAATGGTGTVGGGAKNAAAMAKTRQSRKPGDEGYLTTARYDMEDSGKYHDIDSILSEFDRDVASGRKTRFWQKIPADEYQAALRKFMREGDLFDYPESKLRDWLNRMIGNTMDLEALTTLFSHSEYDPKGEVGEHYNRDFDKSNYFDFLEAKGFDEWGRLPDGSKAISDYGLRPLYSIFNELPSNPTPAEMMVAINRALDVVHARGDLSSIFIEGGRKRLSQISNDTTPDVRYSRRIVPPPAPTTKDIADWLDGKDDVLRKWRRALQDKNIGIRDVEEKLGITNKNESAYYAKDRAFGKNEHELTILQKQEVEPIVEKIHKSGGDLGLFSAYLYARHAGERNAVLKAEKGVDNGSGMNDAQAKTIFDAVDRLGLRAAFEDAAKDVWEMNRKYLQRRVDAGRMTQTEADFLMKRYQHYVPLRTDMTNEELDIFNSTTGGWKRNETMTAKGRKSAADDPLAFSIVQNEQAIRASNANEVRKRWAGVVRRANGELGEIVDGVNKGTAKWAFTFGDGETVETGSPMKLASERDDIILFKENGQLKAIKMKPGEHGRGIELARAVTDKDVVKFSEHLDWIPRATRWMSAMRTQYVPTFIVRNLKADNLEVMLNALSERGLRGENGKSGGVAFFGKFLKNEVSVAKGVKEYFKTGKSSDKYVQEAVENGLLTGGGMAAEGFTETARRLSDTLQALRERPKLLGGTLKAAKDTISLLNSCAEYNTRMGVYKTLREEGMSVADAVSYARDVTVNFNRKGYLTPYTNAAFMFSNAAIQGMGRAFKSMGSEHGKGVVAGLFMVGVAQALLDDWLGHDDEKEKTGGADSRNMTEYDKEHSLGVALPTGHRVKTGIRNPWALPMYVGRKTVELVKGITSGEQAMKDLANAVGNFVTEPVGGNGFGSKAEFLQTLAPTIIDPFVQWGTGKDYRGQDRLKKSFDKTAPQSWNGKERTPEAYKLLAQGLNALTGGNEFRKGWGDSAPEDWQLLTETVFGGVLTDLNNLVKAGGHAVDVARGKPAAQIARDVPFVRDTVTNLPENTSRYFDALDDYERDKAEFKKTADLERRKELRDGKPYLFAGKSLLDGQIERVKELMHLERGEIKSGQKWVEPKVERSEEQKEKYRKQRLALQARILKRLGK